ERFSVADTLVYVDLPLLAHYWGVTKRFAAGLFRTPKGWPENSPVWESTLDSYRVVWLCHRRLTPKYRQLVADKALSKRVHHLKSRVEMKQSLQAVARQRDKPSRSAVTPKRASRRHALVRAGGDTSALAA